MIDKFAHGFINSVYDFNDFTLNELICKLAQKMDEVITQSNESFNYLDWLKNEGASDYLIKLLTQWKDDGTLERLINIEKLNRIETELNDNIENLNSEIQNIAITMPPPSTIDKNTENLQEILNRAKDKNVNLTVNFLGGHYELYTCIIYDNTIIKMTNNTELRNHVTRFNNPYTSETANINILFMNAKPLDNDDCNIFGYNGRSNIVIDGGIIDCISAFCLCHGKNITIKNVTFKNCSSSHYIQIGACKNVKIQNCKFIGTTSKTPDRNYVEFVQVDSMTYAGQPYWSSTSNIYDNTVNDGIEIDNCEFVKGVGDYNFMYTCIGSHSNDNNALNKNITIKNCKFTGYSNRALTINRMKNVTIDNNTFEDNQNTCAIDLTYSNNITVTSSNKILGGRRAISSINSSNVNIDGVLIEKVNADSDIILIGESNNVELNKIRIINSSSTGYNVLIRNSKDVSAYNCQDVNTTVEKGYFFRTYLREEGGLNERITIKGTVTDKKEVLVSSANSIICSKPEILWNTEISSGEILLSDNINKFKNLKIYIKYYNNIIKELNFAGSIAVIRDFNISDDTNQSLEINLVEIMLTLNSETNTITISHNNQIELTNGNYNSVPSVASILRITGERISY